MHLIKKIKKQIGYLQYRKRFIFISPSANVEQSIFEDIGYNSIEGGATILQSDVGRGTYIRYGCILRNTKVGRYCCIAPGVKTVYGEHPTSNCVALHPSFYKDKSIAGLSFGHDSGFEEYKTTKNGYYCEIGNDVWIGTDVKLMAGITVGNGCIIAAGSIVTKDVPSYSIVAGVPAKIIRFRFSQEQVSVLEKYQWWNKDLKWITQNISVFDNIDDFISILAVENDYDTEETN